MLSGRPRSSGLSWQPRTRPWRFLGRRALLERSWQLQDNFLNAIARVVTEGERLGTFAQGCSIMAPAMILSAHWGFALDYALRPNPAKIELIRSSLLSAAAAAVGVPDLLSG